MEAVGGVMVDEKAMRGVHGGQRVLLCPRILATCDILGLLVKSEGISKEKLLEAASTSTRVIVERRTDAFFSGNLDFPSVNMYHMGQSSAIS